MQQCSHQWGSLEIRPKSNDITSPTRQSGKNMGQTWKGSPCRNRTVAVSRSLVTKFAETMGTTWAGASQTTKSIRRDGG